MRSVRHTWISSVESVDNIASLYIKQQTDGHAKAMTCNILVSVPFLAPQPCGQAVIIINAQKLTIYYAVYDAIGFYLSRRA